MNRQCAFYGIFATLIINLFFYSPSTAGVQKGHASSYSNGISMSIAINDWAEPSVFSQSDPVSVAVNFEPGDYAGVPADWWLLAVVPSGECYYPDESGMWIGPVSLSQVQPVAQCGLFPLSGQTVLKVSGLPSGAYHFYFGIDVWNGVIDPSIIYTGTSLTIVETPKSFVTDTGVGTLRKDGPLWILNLQGNYYDMGRQYGGLAKDHLLAFYHILDRDIAFNSQQVQAVLALLEPTMEDRERRLLNGIALESGLTFQQIRFVGASIYFSYATSSLSIGCTVFGATRTQTTTGYTIVGRNFDNPTPTMNQLVGRNAVIIYNPVNEVHGDNHVDNQVSVVTTLGWFFGASIFNARGLNFEYLNGLLSIPGMNMSVADGLHQNLYAALDCDTEDQVDARYLNAKTAAATLTQVSSSTNIWHYERSPYENSMKLKAGQAAGGDYYYANPTDMDIFTNHFFLTNHINQSFKYTSPSNDSDSRSFQRLVNIQKQAMQVLGAVDGAVLMQIMTTKFEDGGTYWDTFGTAIVDQNVYSCVTDINKMTLYVFPGCERERASWVTVNLKQEFRSIQ